MALSTKWVLRLGAVALPLVYWPLTYDHYVLPKLLFARLIVLVLALLLIAQWTVARKIGIKRTPLDLPLLAFIASAVLSALVGVNLNISLFGFYTRYDGVLTLVTYAALFWLAVQSIADGDDARTLLRAMLAGAYLVSAIAIAQYTIDVVTGQPGPRAYGTLGNPNVLGSYLVMLAPVAYYELKTARSLSARILYVNVLAVMVLALVLSGSHSAWLGLAAAAGVLVVAQQVVPLRTRVWQALAGGAGLVVAAATLRFAVSGTSDVSQRAHIWRDTLSLIASRPVFGYGPDTFGLVYPAFQSGKWVIYLQIDKAHSEPLQVAATQGLVGLAVWGWLLAAFVLAFWRGRHPDGAAPLFAGWLGYQVVLLVNFTALSSAFPFWIFAAAAVVRCGATSQLTVAPVRGRWPAVVGAAAAAGLVALAVPALLMPYWADSRLQHAVEADQAQDAATAVADMAAARGLAPQESTYAQYAAGLAYQKQDLEGARADYLEAVRLGTIDPRVYWGLAMTDKQLGLIDEAVAAARQAVYLDRWDPANQALLAQMLDARNR